VECALSSSSSEIGPASCGNVRARAVIRSGWELLAFVLLSNHLHLLLKRPRPNLARGMQQFLSAYALWYGRKQRRAGQVFQGRSRAEMIADESDYGMVSRYIHLNPVRTGRVPGTPYSTSEGSVWCPRNHTDCPPPRQLLVSVSSRV
jgi:REP element-mobilizing transposase RayT